MTIDLNSMPKTLIAFLLKLLGYPAQTVKRFYRTAKNRIIPLWRYRREAVGAGLHGHVLFEGM